MSKWKCEICGKEFENFHAQGFDNKVYCPLCFFKEESRRLKEKVNTYENPEDLTLMFMYCDEKAKDKIKQLKEVIEEVREFVKAKYKEDYSQNDNYVPIERLNLKNCSYERSLQVLEILDKAKGE